MEPGLARILLIVLPVLLALAFTWLILWARRRNSEMNSAGGRSRYGDFLAAFRERDFRRATLLYFTGSLPTPVARAGQLLALAVVVVVGTFVLWFIYRLSQL